MTKAPPNPTPYPAAAKRRVSLHKERGQSERAERGSGLDITVVKPWHSVLARSPRIKFPGAIYNLTAGGNAWAAHSSSELPTMHTVLFISPCLDDYQFSRA